MLQLYFLIVFLSTFFVSSLNSLEYAPVPFSVRALKPKPNWPCKQPTGWSCKDCSTMQYCENGTFEYQITCGVQFPGNAYCNPDTGFCEQDRNVCQEIEVGMKCPDKGLYPDIEDCRKYISCSKQGAYGISYNCLFNSVYNHSQKRCITNSACYNVSIDCKKDFKAIPYNSDNRFYVICRGNDSPMLKDCGRNLIFNATTMSCEFQCSAEGHFANPKDNSSYYICVYNGKTLVKHLVKCVPGTIFNEATGNCIFESKKPL